MNSGEHSGISSGMQGFHRNEKLQEWHFWQSPLPISIPPESGRNLWGTDKTSLFVPTTSVPLPSDQPTIQEPSNFNDDAFELYSPSFQVHLSTSVDTTSQIPATAGSVTSSNHQLYFNPMIPIQVSTTATAVISPSNPSLSA